MSATLQTMSITVVNLQDNRVVFRIFIALLKFWFDSPSYINFLLFQCSVYMQHVKRVQISWNIISFKNWYIKFDLLSVT